VLRFKGLHNTLKNLVVIYVFLVVDHIIF